MTTTPHQVGVHPDRVGRGSDRTRVPVSTAPTLGAALLDRYAREPDAPAYYLLDGDDGFVRLSVAELAALAGGVAAVLVGRGVAPGDRVGISLDTGPDTLAALFGAALAGAVPFMTQIPFGAARHRAWADGIRPALRLARPRAFITGPDLADTARELCGSEGVIPLRAPFAPRHWDRPAPADPEALAFIQFTSGTTSHAKAVSVTHRALFANAEAIGERLGFGVDDLVASWLPLYHDMGLVGITLSPFLHGIPGGLMSPLAFAFRPERWLREMHRLRASISAAPNFAYQLCAAKVPESALSGLDLSCWRAALNGAEFVDARTVEAFIDRMAPYGFTAGSLLPCYGMAELGLAASCHRPGRPPRVERVRRASALGGQTVCGASGEDWQDFVSAGPPLVGTEIAILGEDGRPLPDRRQGRIMVRSTSLMAGYYRQPEETAKVLSDGWLDTGDLGFLSDGDLFVTGRHKDLIIVGGRNYHPYALETAAAEVPVVRRGSVAAVACYDPELRREAFVLVVEIKGAPGAGERLAIREAVERTVVARTGLHPDRVMTVAPGTLPKTSSGKLQRPRIAAMVAAGSLADGAGRSRPRAA